MNKPDFSHLTDNAPIHSFIVSYMYMFGTKPVFSSVEFYLDRPLRPFDGKLFKSTIMGIATPNPVHKDNIVILSVSPIGVIPKSVYLQLAKENRR